MKRFWSRLVRFSGETVLSPVEVGDYRRIRDRGARILQSAQLEFAETASYDAFCRLPWGWSTNDPLRRKKDLKAVQQVPGLAQVFVEHPDGYVREAALKHLDAPLTASACVYALFWRTNDWVPEVRAAARQALARVMPSTSADVIAPALKAALPRIACWGRWSQAGPETIAAFAQREDVARTLIDDVIQSQGAALTTVFRELCKNPMNDPQFERIFRTAHQPHIRAMALQILLSGTAKWPVNQQQKVWTDRSLGHYRMQMQFLSRDITVDVDQLALLQRAVTDRAAIVRKHAFDGMIALRHDREIAHKFDELAAGFENDPNFGVRSRVEFFQRKRCEENQQ